MPDVISLSVEQLQAKIEAGEDFILLDVRGPEEFALANLGGTLIPLQVLEEHVDELDKTKEIVVLCHHGVRSLHAAHFLLANGFEKVASVRGGIDQWSARIDPDVPRY